MARADISLRAGGLRPLSLHDALPIWGRVLGIGTGRAGRVLSWRDGRYTPDGREAVICARQMRTAHVGAPATRPWRITSFVLPSRVGGWGGGGTGVSASSFG